MTVLIRQFFFLPRLYCPRILLRINLRILLVIKLILVKILRVSGLIPWRFYLSRLTTVTLALLSLIPKLLSWTSFSFQPTGWFIFPSEVIHLQVINMDFNGPCSFASLDLVYKVRQWLSNKIRPCPNIMWIPSGHPVPNLEIIIP